MFSALLGPALGGMGVNPTGGKSLLTQLSPALALAKGEFDPTQLSPAMMLASGEMPNMGVFGALMSPTTPLGGGGEVAMVRNVGPLQDPHTLSGHVHTTEDPPRDAQGNPRPAAMVDVTQALNPFRGLLQGLG